MHIHHRNFISPKVSCTTRRLQRRNKPRPLPKLQRTVWSPGSDHWTCSSVQVSWARYHLPYASQLLVDDKRAINKDFLNKNLYLNKTFRLWPCQSREQPRHHRTAWPDSTCSVPSTKQQHSLSVPGFVGQHRLQLWLTCGLCCCCY